jgi:hypothetical protein
MRRLHLGPRANSGAHHPDCTSKKNRLRSGAERTRRNEASTRGARRTAEGAVLSCFSRRVHDVVGDVSPSSFAFVMSTGAASIATHVTGRTYIARPLLYLNVFSWAFSSHSCGRVDGGMGPAPSVAGTPHEGGGYCKSEQFTLKLIVAQKACPIRRRMRAERGKPPPASTRTIVHVVQRRVPVGRKASALELLHVLPSIPALFVERIAREQRRPSEPARSRRQDSPGP